MSSTLEQRTVIAERCVLYKQSRSKRWYVRIKLKNGSWDRRATGTDDLREAQEIALELFYKARFNAEHNLPQTTRSFSSVAKHIVADLEERRGTDAWKSVYKDYVSVIKRYQIPYFKRSRLDNVRKRYEGYLDYVAEQMGRTPTTSTVNTHHAALKLILDDAVRQGWLTHAGLPQLKNTGKAAGQRATFDIGEYRRMISKLRYWSQRATHRERDQQIRSLLYDYVLILAYSGVRHGREALDIKWQNVRFVTSNSGRELVVMNVLKRKGRGGTETWRQVVVRHNNISNAKKVLCRLKDRVEALRDTELEKLVGSSNAQPIFALADGSVPTRLDSAFKRFLKEAELHVGAEEKPRTLYSMRHFYATQQLTSRKPISVTLLAKQMGTSVAMIERYYGHLDTVKQGDVLSGWTEF